MKVDNQQHRHYCGVDPHAGQMFVCLIAQKSKIQAINLLEVGLGGPFSGKKGPPL